MTTVVIADDHPMVRQGLRAVLDAFPGIDVIGEAGDGRAAVDLVIELAPDVVLMDLQMPELHGIEATLEITARCPRTAVLVLTMYEDDDTVFAAVGAGAAGYLLKGADGGDITAAVQSAAAGHAVFGASLALRLRSWFAGGRSEPEVRFPELTDRERDILDHLAAGHSNAAIGDRLHLSAKTVANNVSNILNKLHLVNRSEAIVRAREAGLGHGQHDKPTLG
jgi:DNA-binding NarL/FixJ family response regulator